MPYYMRVITTSGTTEDTFTFDGSVCWSEIIVGWEEESETGELTLGPDLRWPALEDDKNHGIDAPEPEEPIPRLLLRPEGRKCVHI